MDIRIFYDFVYPDKKNKNKVLTSLMLTIFKSLLKTFYLIKPSVLILVAQSFLKKCIKVNTICTQK